MAYAALSSLHNSICHIQKFSRLSSLLYTFDELDYFEHEIGSTEIRISEMDEMRDRKGFKAMDAQLQDAVLALEDVLDSVFIDLIQIAQSDQFVEEERRSMYREQVQQAMLAFTVRRDKILEETCLRSDDEDEGDTHDDQSGIDEEIAKKVKVVGANAEKLITKILHQVNTPERREGYELRVVSIVGAPGTGRSFYGWCIFNSIDAIRYNYSPVWVGIGPKYDFKQILASILSQIDAKHEIDKQGEEELFESVHTILKYRRYLIVLDDVRETEVWEYLRNLFPDENNGSRVILTTDAEEVADFAQSFCIHRSHVLSNEESRNVIDRVVYRKRTQRRERERPKMLEEAINKIVEDCGGFLVRVTKYACMLSDRYPTSDDRSWSWSWNWSWSKLVEGMKSLVAAHEYDEISQIKEVVGDGDLMKLFEVVLGTTLRDIKKTVLLHDKMFHKVGAVVGMAGIGKTTVAREVFNSPWTLTSYDYRVWLNLGPMYEFDRLLEDIIVQLNPNVDKLLMEDDESSVKLICSMLYGKTCFIVLDNVWGHDPWKYLRKFIMLIKCEVLLTTRLSEILLIEFPEEGTHKIHEMQLLNKEESWSLLQRRVFGEEMWSHELEKPGKLIAEHCEGLPLMIIMVGSLLSKAGEKTVQYWHEVEKKKNSLFEIAYLNISKVLYPSYKNLDVTYKPCFLYLGGFYLKYMISIPKLYLLYEVEGLTMNWFEAISACISIFCGKSLVLMEYKGRYDNCRLHSVFWHFCVREAKNVKLFHVLNKEKDAFAEDILDHRRLCIQNNVLFAHKDVYNSMASVPGLRSLLCFAPPHPYQVPICLESNFIKVLDALSIRFYEFPVGILKLVLLKYLALNYNGDLPASLSKLWNLAFLIVNPSMSIKFPGCLSYLPVEIWDMKELKHLQVMGSNLPDPPSGVVLEKLETLLDVRTETCTKSILEKIPNLRNLGIHIELEPENTLDPMFSFDHISYLEELESFKCVVANPELKPTLTVSPFSILPSSLREVSLSGLGYNWEQIRPIALLPFLQDLELKSFAFRGAEWTMHEGDFENLTYLLLEDTDLVNWRADKGCNLNSLSNLNVHHCFKLKEIPWNCFYRYCTTELIDCNPSVSKTMPKNDKNVVICSWLEA